MCRYLSVSTHSDAVCFSLTKLIWEMSTHWGRILKSLGIYGGYFYRGYSVKQKLAAIAIVTLAGKFLVPPAKRHVIGKKLLNPKLTAWKAGHLFAIQFALSSTIHPETVLKPTTDNCFPNLDSYSKSTCSFFMLVLRSSFMPRHVLDSRDEAK